MNPEAVSQNKESKFREIYSAPTLVIYGAVRSLTQGGSGNFNENYGNPNMCANDIFPNRQLWRPCSERRVKESIVRIGDHPLGFGLYLFDYRPEFRAQWGHGRQFGVMIDEVEHVMPEAVSLNPDGYKRVDHSLLGLYQHKH